MSDNLGILTTSGVVSNAAQAGPGFAILGDLTNKGKHCAVPTLLDVSPTQGISNDD